MIEKMKKKETQKQVNTNKQVNNPLNKRKKADTLQKKILCRTRKKYLERILI